MKRSTDFPWTIKKTPVKAKQTTTCQMLARLARSAEGEVNATKLNLQSFENTKIDCSFWEVMKCLMAT